MKERPARRAGWFWIGLVWTGVMSCDGSKSAAPGNSDQVRSMAELPNVQVLFEGIAPLNAAVYRTDSILGGIVVGRIALDGKPGDEVGLQLDIPDYVLESTGSNARVRVVGPDRSESFTLLQLSQGMIVYRLARGGQTRLTVELDRSVEGVREGAVRLLLRTGATIRSAELPWQRGTSPRKPASLSVQTSCTLQIGSGSCGTMTYTVVPSTSTTLPPGYLEIGGTFQSTAGNGPSSTIRLTFSLPIYSITTTIHDPTWAGNRMTGVNLSTGQQVSVDFVGNGTPGTTTTDVKTLTGSFTVIDLVPAANDYVSYDVEVVLAPCPPTGRPELDDPNNINGMFKALDSTLADPLKRERAGAGYQYNAPPNFYTLDVGSVAGNTECTSSYQAFADTSATVVFYLHTHGMTPPARSTANCTTLPVGTPYAKGPSGCASVLSTSPCDLAMATRIGKKMYIIDQYDLYEIVPGMRTNRTGSYNKKWKVDRASGCFK